jgi:hypothetical protein
MKRIGVCLILLLLPVPVIADCQNSGFSIVYVNGILTSKESAEQDSKKLWDVIGMSFENQSINVYPGYNASHLAGYGDLVESATQGISHPVSDFDLVTILNQIAPEVTTQKVLLVGHSQGTFYTNEMYEYLLAHGVATGSVAVYNLATPASFVAGDGAYLTSTADKVINKVRETDATFHAPLALAGNITLPQEPGYDADGWGGHGFSSVYLAFAANKIVRGAQDALSDLKAGAPQSGSCYTPPGENLGYRVEHAAFAVADPLAGPADAYVVQPQVRTYAPIANAALAIATTIVDKGLVGAARQGIAAAEAWETSASLALDREIAGGIFQIFPKPDAQSASAAFAIEKSLYGSSLSVEEYRSLLGGQNPAEAPTQSLPQQEEAPVPDGAQTQPQETSAPPTPRSTAPSQAQLSLAPGFGGGYAPHAPQSSQEIADVGANTPSGDAPSSSSGAASGPYPAPSPGQDQHAPAPSPADIPLAVLSPEDEAISGVATIRFSGTTTPGSIVTIGEGEGGVSTSADESGAWALELAASEGAHRFTIGAADGSGSATSTTRAVTVNTAAPDAPRAALTECAHSIVSPCFVTTPSLTLSWGDATNAAYYEILRNGIYIGTTQATTSAVSADLGTTTVFAVVAHSYSEQTATSSDVTVFVGTHTEVSGALAADQVWSPSGNPYVVNSTVTIPAGTSLTIEPGTIVKVGSGASPDAFAVSGTLTIGGAGDAVVITSLKDDTVSGDTNGDGGASSPASGDWTRINVLSGGFATIRNAKVRYGGARVFNPAGFFESAMIRNDGGAVLVDNAELSDSVDALVQLGSATSTILRTAFRTTSDYGVWAHGGGSVTVLDSTFDTSSTANINAQGSSLHIGNDTFAARPDAQSAVMLSSSQLVNDGGNTGVGTIAIGSLVGGVSTTLPKDGVPYQIMNDGNTTVPANTSLTILPGAVVKTTQNGLTVAGTLTAGRSGAEPVIFTSLLDDSAMGHSSGSLAGALAPGDWVGIIAESGATVTLDTATISYAGNCVYEQFLRKCAAIRNAGGTVNLAHVSLLHSYNSDFEQDSGTSSVTFTTFTASLGAWVLNGSLVLRDSSFANGRAMNGVNANGAVDAAQNWWGDASGPYNPSHGPSGTGSYVADGVSFEPWLLCDPLLDNSCAAKTSAGLVQ